MICEDCDMDGDETPATVTWRDPWGHPYAHLCTRHAEQRTDRHEPPTFDEALSARCGAQERDRQAYRLKRG